MIVAVLPAELEALRAEAETAYRSSLSPGVMRSAWHAAVDASRKELAAALAATSNLTGIQEALEQSGGFVRALRHLMSPPLSQDQFKLACAGWGKSTEKSGRGMSREQARVVAAAVAEWLDPRIVDELAGGSDDTVLRGAVYLMASQRFQTERRSALAGEQERAACNMLEAAGFLRTTSAFVDQHGIVQPQAYMQKTKFLTADGGSHEVDLAVGFAKNLVLAIECKVSNDATNSIKRVNDVLKKHAAWKNKWGDFLVTGALLQGVYAPRDIDRLRQAGVAVFWSHHLEGLRAWVEERQRVV